MITNSIIIHPSTQARSLAIPVFFLYSCTFFPFTKKKKKKTQKNTHTQTKTKKQNKSKHRQKKKTNLKQQQSRISIYQICLDCTHFFHCLCYFPNSENKHLSPGFLGGKNHILFFFLLQWRGCLFLQFKATSSVYSRDSALTVFSRTFLYRASFPSLSFPLNWSSFPL